MIVNREITNTINAANPSIRTENWAKSKGVAKVAKIGSLPMSAGIQAKMPSTPPKMPPTPAKLIDSCSLRLTHNEANAATT